MGKDLKNKDLITKEGPYSCKCPAAIAGLFVFYFYCSGSLEIVGQMNQFSICSRAVTSRMSSPEPEDSIR